LLLGLLSPQTAFADQTGATGRVTKVSVNAQGSDKFASFHGSVTIRAGSKTRTYFWGGTACPAQSLTASEIELLSDALNNRSRTSVTPRYRGGQAGGERCLVGFELVASGS
jgi:hypothetical protein